MRKDWPVGLIALLAALVLTACGGSASTAYTTRAPEHASTAMSALTTYLNAVANGDCTTAEKFALRSAFVNGDLCVRTRVGPLVIDGWRRLRPTPTPARETAYEVDVHVSRTTDGTPVGWRTRFVSIQKIGDYYYVASVATGP